MEATLALELIERVPRSAECQRHETQALVSPRRGRVGGERAP